MLAADEVFSAYTDKVDTLSAAAQDKSQTLISRLTQEVELLQAQVKLDTTTSDEVHASFAKEQSKAKSSEMSLAKTRTALSQTEKEMSLLREQVRLDREGIEQLQAMLNAERAKTSAQAASTRTIQASFEAKLKEAEQAAITAREKAEAESGQMIQQLREQVRLMSASLENYHGQVENFESERGDLLCKIDQLHRGQEDLEGYYDQARRLTDQVTSMSDELLSLRAQLEERDGKITWLQTEIAKIYRSRSYRLMTPLRKIRKAID
ncbi:hypothetical protein ACSBLW_14385 [Thioclava sp. FR2]|uniref:hypothetical protein n=1 Tax=Thioclava sp. FR2 TaxID=3445780 RepID=UPI003EB9F198